MFKEIEEIELIDVHAHPFSNELKLEKNSLAQLCAIGAPSYDDTIGSIEDLQSLIFYRYLIKLLGNLLKIKEEDLILRKRNELIKNFQEYLELLFREAKIKGFVIDDGHSEAKGENVLPKFDIDSFERNLPKWIRIRYVHRIEPDIKYAFGSSNNFSDFLSIIEERISNFSKLENYSGFKTIIAYRTGLDFKWRSEEEAKKEFEEYKSNNCERAWFGPVMKAVREYVICLLVERLAKSNKVLKIHTGIGDRDILLERSFPYKLFDFLKNERARKTKIVLVHGGYPNNVFSSYIANALPNVYFDISIACPFGLVNLKQRILESLELAPFKKIMYASDGYIIPELHFVSSFAFRKNMRAILEEMIKSELLNEDEAIKVFEDIAYRNAIQVFSF